MPFDKVNNPADFPAQERAALDFWRASRAFDRLRAKNRGKKRWSFLDGPITANNPMGVHHAWGRTYKDAFNRYFAMTGHEQRYQNGFDCQGLWVEVEVEKELKLASKRDIENLVPGDAFRSIDKFVTLCKQRVDKFARVQSEQSIRLGMWMDWDVTDEDWAKYPDERKSYFTMSDENNYTIWAFLKKCHQKGIIHRGYDVMPWCGRCGVGLSEQEMKEGYRLTEHKSLFVRLPLKGRPNESLLVWTTTPWTLTSNVGAAVNPELTYLKVKLKGEVYYVAKGAFKLDRMAGGDDESEPGASATGKKSKRDWIDGVPHLSSIEQHFKAKAGKDGYEIVGEVKGSELIGWEYDGPFDDLPAQQHDYGFPEEVAQVTKQQGWCPARSAAKSHRVISGGADVTETEGTGIVHTAPGCGQIDYGWGKEYGLPPVAPIGDDGLFVSGFGSLTGKSAADPGTAELVTEELKKRDRLFASERYVHRYPHCWRCKTELLYRLVDEWFIGMGPRLSEEGFRGDIMKVVRKPEVKFLPESLNGTARELDWLRNMGDWMISKKRFWGLALPVWVDDKDPTQFEVIGSREELKQRAVAGWPEFDGHSPHRPWIDKVKIRNPKTGNLMSRVPDVGNPWLDAGIVAFSTMGWNTDRAEWRKWYPADFITESFPGQFRNWFYALLAMSTMMSDGEPPFRTLLGFATVQDQYGNAMHKNDGNSIEFIGAADSGFELFHTCEPGESVDKALSLLPKGHVAKRTEEVTLKDGAKTTRVVTKYRPIGADVIRWLYCRHNPAANINFGPEPADEVRAKFILKLWNVYAFFCNYAQADGFDPKAKAVPVKDRPDIDRWLLSDLRALTEHARSAFERFDVMAFCLEAESFVDDRLSNWYVRRNRDRFWSKNTELDDAGRCDKLAAYQTLYTTLKTLCRLLAPVVPFLAETMWRNLRTEADPDSVHLTDYPQADELPAEEELSKVMDGLLRLVTLGRAARDAAKIRVRQPLAELSVQPASDAESKAVSHFSDQLCDELNVKRVTLHDGANGPLLRLDVKPNPKTLGPKFGARLKEAMAVINATPAAELARLVQSGSPFEIGGFALEPSDFWVTQKAADGWAGFLDRGTQVAIDARLTDELKREGMARDVVRQVQELRKTAQLDMQDRIVLYLATESVALKQAIDAHRDAIAAETLTARWSDGPLGDGAHRAQVKVEGQPLTIELRKA